MVIIRTGLIALITLAAALAARNAAAQEPPHPMPHPQISITGSASAHAAPDTATFTTGVVSEGKTAADAMKANNEAMAAVVAAMKDEGIEPRDLQTSGFRVDPVYTPHNAQNGQPRAPRIESYRVTNTLTVRVRDLGKLGALLDKAVSVGSNEVGGIAFDIAEKDKLLDDARREAVADARRRAEIYSTAAVTRLGRVLTISEDGYRPVPQPMMMRREMASPAAAPVEAGELELTVSVTVTWELVQ
ncbi:MAG: SIMPL domain-containing protein [Pseudorhodoplanes sp.]